MIGEQEVYICLTEFQKHRLPHGHLLSIATAEFAAYIMDPKNLNKFISAELHNDHPQLHQKAVKYMLNGPCGKLNPKAFVATKVGFARNFFQKSFSMKPMQI